MPTRRWFSAARDAHNAAAPASTLLLATVLTMTLASFARLAAADVPARVHVSERASPERTIEVAVEAAPTEHIEAWLPGLHTHKSRLAYDPKSGYHLATLSLPQDAPDTGWCTVRVVFDGATEHDLRVALDPTTDPGA